MFLTLHSREGYRVLALVAREDPGEVLGKFEII